MTTRAEQKINRTRKVSRKLEFYKKKQCKQTVDKLNNGILRRDADFAGSATTSQQQVAEQRNIVVRRYLAAAFRTMGSGKNQ